MKTLSIVLLFGAVMTLMAAEVNEINLIKNADFAKMYGDNPGDFQVVVAPGSMEITGENGNKVLKLTKQEEKSCMVVQRELPLDADKPYIFSCEVKSANEGKGMIYVEWRTRQADSQYQHKSVNAVPFEPSDEWCGYTFTIPARPAEAEKPYIVFVGVKNSVEFRNLKLVEAK